MARLRNPLYEGVADIALKSDSRRPARMAERIVAAIHEYLNEVSIRVPFEAGFG
jgi:hypothetical protein